MGWVSHVAGLALCAALAAGCADTRPESRVGGGVMPKSFFVGEGGDAPEFWFRSMLLETGAAARGILVPGYAARTSRVRWRITEDRLLAHVSEPARGGPARGDVVVAYPILSHFDLRDEDGVAVENATSRPWQERSYMRVDWSKDVGGVEPELDMVSLAGVHGAADYTPIALHVSAPDNELAPFVDPERGYLDVSGKTYATWNRVEVGGIEVPACALTALGDPFVQGDASCEPSELTFRQAFLRVDDHDYEPAEWDEARARAFGAATLEPASRGAASAADGSPRSPIAARHGLWLRSHVTGDDGRTVACATEAGADPHRDLDSDGTEDECASIGRGSRCDRTTGACTLPYRDRETSPVVWYYVAASPPELFDATEAAVHEWDVALRGAVMAARHVECVRTGELGCASTYPVAAGQQRDDDDAVALVAEISACRAGAAYVDRGANRQACDELAEELGSARGVAPAVIALAKLDEMAVLCHSPVQNPDAPACGPRGRVVRRGDLRYHAIEVTTEPSARPWTVFTGAEDPVTGEQIADALRIDAWATMQWSTYVTDLVRMAEGVVASDGGDGVATVLEASQRGVLGGIRQADVERRLADFTGVDAAAFASVPASIRADAQLEADLSGVRGEVGRVAADAMAKTTTRGAYDARRKAAIGTDFETELTTAPLRELAATDLVELASPLRATSLDVQRDLSTSLRIALAARGACIVDDPPPPASMAALVGVLDAKFGKPGPAEDKAARSARADRIQAYVARRAHTATVAHGLGHALGLAHDLAGSADARNYRPQYWQLRTANGAVTTPCTDLATDGSACVGPRYFDPLTDEERSQRIGMFASSSVMEDLGDATASLPGLGSYDFAAARMLYGDAVAVYIDVSYGEGSARGQGTIAALDDFGGVLGISPRLGSDEIHYSGLQQAYGLIGACAPVDPARFRPARWDEARDGAYDPLLDSGIVEVGGEPTRCTQPRVDYVGWGDLRAPVGAPNNANHAVDSAGRVRVPHAFAGERWADAGNPSVAHRDAGADAYELVDFLSTEEESARVLDPIRLRKPHRSPAMKVLAAHWRLERMRDVAKGIALLATATRDLALERGVSFDDVWALQPAATGGVLAAGAAFDELARMTARPSPDRHVAVVDDPVLRSSPDAPDGATRVSVPATPTSYGDDIGLAGGWLDGSPGPTYYDKAFAAALFSESLDNLVTSSDGAFLEDHAHAVGLADAFPEGYRRWLANHLSGDDAVLGPRLAADPAGAPLLAKGGKAPAAPISWTRWWTASAPEICAPSAGAALCSSYEALTGGPSNPAAAAHVAILDPQIGAEPQRFLAAWTLLYLPTSEAEPWLPMLDVWESGADGDPGFAERIELHDPTGKVYVARTFGKEVVFGKSVQCGIGARVLEHANALANAAYETTPGPDLDGDGQPDWSIPLIDPVSGQPVVKYDHVGIGPGCTESDSSGCTCASNRACVALERQLALLSFLRRALAAYGLAAPNP